MLQVSKAVVNLIHILAQHCCMLQLFEHDVLALKLCVCLKER